MLKWLSTILIYAFFSTSSSLLYGQTPVKRIQGKAASKIIRNSEEVIINNKTGIPTFIKYKEGKYSRNNIGQALRDLPISKDIHFERAKSFRDQRGGEHVRMNQYYRGLEVVGAQMVFHLKDNRLVSSNGQLVAVEEIDVQPTLSNEAALLLAKSEMLNSVLSQYDHIDLARDELAQQYYEAELCLSRESYDPQNPLRLVYQFEINLEQPIVRYVVEVDASTGEVLNMYSRIHKTTVDGTGVTEYNGIVNIKVNEIGVGYELRDDSRGNGIFTYDLGNGTDFDRADLFFEQDSHFDESNSHSGVSAHFGAAATYDFFKFKYGRNSYDGSGASINSYVHYGFNFSNAFWDGTAERMVYGDGDGITFDPLVSLDIVGHEITHAVTENSANLIYSFESGALNESFSDIFGIAVETYVFPNSKNWEIAEEIYVVDGDNLRSMSDPNSRGHPDTYLGEFWEFSNSDNGGVHTNSGVQNHWFYLLSDGGSGINDKGYFYMVSGIGLEKATDIAYRNLTAYLTPSSQYGDARIGAEMAATDLYGENSIELQNVKEAWNAAGVPASYPSMVMSADELSFEAYSIGDYQTESLQLFNNGNAPIEIANITVSNQTYLIERIEVFSLPVGDSFETDIQYIPNDFEVDAATITISTNIGVFEARLFGEGIAPFNYDISPMTFEVEIGPNANTTIEVNLTNNNLYSYNLNFHNSADWLTFSNSDPMLAGGAKKEFSILIDSEGLLPGTYTDEVEITFQNPEVKSETVSVELTVLSLPDISVPEEVTFNSLLVNHSTQTIVEIVNSGFEEVVISGFSFSNDIFSTSATATTLEPGHKLEVPINLNPSEVGDFSEYLSIMSNDHDSPTTSVLLEASVINPIHIEIEDTSRQIRIWPETSDIQTFTITNLESGLMNWSMDLVETTMGSRNQELLTFSVTEGVLQPSESIEVDMTIDAMSTSLGEYSFELHLSSSSFDIPDVITPIDVSVIVPEIAVTQRLDFKSGWIGFDKKLYLEIDNLGTDTLRVSEISIDVEHFNLNSEMDFKVPPGSKEKVWLTFTPESTDNIDGLLTIYSNDPASEQVTVQLTGKGVDPSKISYDQNQIRQEIKTASTVNITFPFKNIGLGDLHWNALIFSVNRAPTELIQINENNQGILGTNENGNLTLSIISDDIFDGAYNYVLYLYTNDPGSKVIKIPIEVTVLAPSIIVAQSLNFGKATIGDEIQKQLTISNGGSDILFVSDIALGESVFDLNSEKSFQIEPNESKNLDLNFYPNDRLDYTDDMIIYSNAPYHQEQNVSLKGQGLNPAKILIQNEKLEAAVKTGSEKELPLLFENVGDSDLNWNIEIVDLTNKSNVSIQIEALSGSIESMSSLELSILIDATELTFGLYDYEIVIKSNDPEKPEVVVPMEVEVLSPSILTTEGLIFNETTIGKSEYRQIAILNVGNDTLDISNISANDQAFQIHAEGQFFLVPGDSTKIELEFIPKERKTYSSMLTISSNDPLHSDKQIMIGGTGLAPANLKLVDSEILVQVESGSMKTETFSFENSGDEPLNWSLSFDLLEEKMEEGLELNQKKGSLEGNMSTNVPFTIDASKLPWGEYSYNLQIATSEQESNTVVLPLTVMVLGSEIRMPELVEFDTIKIGEVTRSTLHIQNSGNDSAMISVATIDGGSFKLVSIDSVIAAGQQGMLEFEFRPKVVGNALEQIELITNDVTKPVVNISLSGIATEILYAEHLEEGCKIYPNPVDKHFIIETPYEDHLTIVLYDLLGNAIFSKEIFGSASHKIELDHSISAGIYQLLIKGEITKPSKLKLYIK